MQRHLSHYVSDNNRDQTPIGSSQIKSDFIRRILAIPVLAFSEIGKKFSLIIKYFSTFLANELFSSLSSVRVVNLKEEEEILVNAMN